jgi:hypothetical protein
MHTTQADSVSHAETITEFPLTHAQQVAWFLYKFAPQSYIDKLAFAVRCSQQLDYECLNQAFQALIKRHPSLHTAYIERQGEVVQLVVGSSKCLGRIRECNRVE